MSTFEYAVVHRRQERGKPAQWEFWARGGVVRREASFLAIMNHAGALGFEAFAAGSFDEMEVPEVLLKRSIPAPPPPPHGTKSAAAPAAAKPPIPRASQRAPKPTPSTKPAAKPVAQPVAKTPKPKKGE